MQLLILSFVFLIKEAKPFEYYQCEGLSNCKGPYPSTVFEHEFLNDLYNSNTKGNFIKLSPLDEETEIAINLDGVNKSLNIYLEKREPKEIKLVLETKASDFSKREDYPKILAVDIDVIIDNQNSLIDKSVVPYKTISCRSLSSKNQNKPLHLYFDAIYYTNFDDIKDSIVYVSAFNVEIKLYEPVSRTIHIYFVDSLIYAYGNYNQGTQIKIKTYLKCNHEYTKDNLKISFELSNYNFNIHATSPKIKIINDLAPGCLVEGPYLNNPIPGALIYPHLIYKNTSTDYPTITKIWPFMQKKYYDGYTHEDGKYVQIFEKYCYIEGTFKFYSGMFYLDNFENMKLVLPDDTYKDLRTSIYLNNGVIFDKLITIESTATVNTIFSIYGEPLNLKGSSAINTNSEKLQIYVNSIKPIQHSGPATIILNGIDNSNYAFKETVQFREGGTIKIPYGVNKNALIDKITDIYNDYTSKNPAPEEESFSNMANHYIDFVKNKITDLSTIINNVENTISPVTIIPKSSEDLSSDDKTKLVFTRQDFPFSLLYQNNLNKELKAVCFENSKISLDKWQKKFNVQIIQSICDLFDIDFEESLSKYYPQISNSSINGDLIEIGDDCIGFKPANIPSSTIDLFVYTENQTYIEILSKLNVIHLLSSSDLDAYSKLKNKNSMNLVILVLDDLPNGKSINLNGVRQDANIFLVGYKSASIEDLYGLIEVLRKSGNDKEKRDKLSEILKQYTKYQVKASITYDVVQTVFLGLINYDGSHVRCANLISFLSSMSNIDKDFAVTNTVIDSVSYKTLSNVKVNNLILFPVALNPVDLLMVEQVIFTDGQWKLLFNGYYNEEIPDNYKSYEVSTDKIEGKFYLYSLTENCAFNIPNDAKVTKVKGISLVSDFKTNFNIRTIPGIMILEDVQISQEISKITKSFLLEDGSSTQISFTGNWEQVKEIQGSIEIDSGTKSAAIENVPNIVAQSLDVQSEKKILLNTQTEKIEFKLPQVFKNNKEIAFSNKDIEVSFSNITLAGNGNTDFTLLLGNEKAKVVTDSITVNEDVSGKINGDLEVKQTFELGPGSSLVANSIITENPTLILNYRLRENFAQIPDTITTPSSVILNYIGENDNIDDIVDYSMYANSVKAIKSFENEDACTKYLNVIQLQSKFYTEFRGENAIVTPKCVSELLRLDVTKTPTGEIEIPPIEPIILPTPVQNGPPKKKKFPVGGIVGIVIGVLVVIAVVAVLVWFFVFHRKKDNRSENEGDDQDQSNI